MNKRRSRRIYSIFRETNVGTRGISSVAMRQGSSRRPAWEEEGEGEGEGEGEEECVRTPAKLYTDIAVLRVGTTQLSIMRGREREREREGRRSE